MEWRQRDGLRWLEAELGTEARAVFTTRLGGASSASYDSLNLNTTSGDSEVSVAENRRRLAAALELNPARVPIARQIHGTELVRHTGPPPGAPFATPGSPPPEHDGHVITAPGLAPLVFAADCFPVVLAGPGGVAVLHCGWRGLAAGILSAGAAAVGATRAAVGPGVGCCCFDAEEGMDDAFAPLGGGILASGKADLVEVIRRQLAAAGVGEVEVAGLCTSCHQDLFFSFQRDGARTGRQAGLAWIGSQPG